MEGSRPASPDPGADGVGGADGPAELGQTPAQDEPSGTHDSLPQSHESSLLNGSLSPERDTFKSKTGGVKYEHVERLKQALRDKFGTVADAYVFFDIVASGFITFAQFRRALDRLGVGALAHPGLFKELNWHCVETKKVYEREFFDLFQWHAIDDRSKFLAQARVRREQNLKAESNKAMSVKAKSTPRPTPECNKLREILPAKFTSVTDFMVALDMDLTDVSTPTHFRVGFKRLGITEVSVEEIFKELEEASLPRGMLRNSLFARVVKWHPIDDLQAELTRSRLKLTHQRASVEVTHLPALRTSIREGPSTKAFRKLLQKHFDNVVDAFVFFDLDCSSEVNRSKFLHGLARMKHFTTEDDPAVIGEELVREFMLVKDSGLSVSEFIFRLKWHDVKHGTDLDQIVFDARKKLKKLNAEAKANAPKPRPPRNARQRVSSPRHVGKERSGSTEQGPSPSNPRLVSDCGEEESLQSPKPESKLEEAEAGDTDGAGVINHPQPEEDAASPVAADAMERHDAARNRTGSDQVGSPARSPKAPPKAARASKVDRAKPLAGSTDSGRKDEKYFAELAWLDEKMGRSLQLDSLKRLRWESRPKQEKRDTNGRKQGSSSSRKGDKAVRQLIAALSERGLEELVEAYAFFDIEGGGQLTPFQMQRGLGHLRIFHVSVHDLRFRFEYDEPVVPTISISEFLLLFAPHDARAAALARLAEEELEGKLQEAMERRGQIVDKALAATGSATDLKVQGLRSRMMEGLSVQVPAPDLGHKGRVSTGPVGDTQQVLDDLDGPREQGGGETESTDVSMPNKPISPDEVRPPESAWGDASGAGDGNGAVDSALEGVDDAQPLGVYGQHAQDPTADMLARVRSRSSEREEGGGRAVHVSPVVDAPLESSNPDDGEAPKMMRAKEDCVPLFEHHAAFSVQMHLKDGFVAAASAGGIGDGEGLADSPSAPTPRQSTYKHTRHGGVAFRISAEEEGSETLSTRGDSSGGFGRSGSGWTGQALYQRLLEDGDGEIELDTIVERLGRLKMGRGRIGMLVTRLCAQQQLREEEDGAGIAEEAFVLAFEAMEEEWQNEQPLAEQREASPRPTGMGHDCGVLSGEEMEENPSRWAHFDDGLDEEEEEEASSPLGVLATLEAQRVAQKERFERVSMGGGNWYEGQTDGAGNPHGSGLLVLAPGDEEGRRWQLGTFRGGALAGPGVMVMWDASFYLGDFKDGRPHGAGVQTMVNDVVYEGEFRDGRKDGVGCVWVDTGPAFFGEWVLGERHGRGVSGSCNRAWLRPRAEGELAGRQRAKGALPHSEVRTAVKFEEWVYVSSGMVSSASKHLATKHREQMLEAMLWNSAQARSAACEGWSQGEAILHRMDTFMAMMEKIQPRSPDSFTKDREWTSAASLAAGSDARGPKRVLLPVADKFKHKEPPFFIPRIPVFNAITRQKPA